MSAALPIPQESVSLDTIESLNPATGEVNGRFSMTPAEALPGILQRAREAQAAWGSRPVADRCRILRRLGRVLYDRREEAARLVTREAGKPRAEALFAEILISLDTIEYYAKAAPQLLRPERVPHHNPALKAKRGWLCNEPLGVIVMITPWNYPLAVPMGTLIPALAAGNAVVLKPSEIVPGCGALIGELVKEAGFPDGLVTVVQGRGEVGGALIAAGPDKIIFTGSVATGKRVAEACAARLIPSVLELGGKDAMIVLADADVDVASSAAVWGGFTNCGQACLSVERVYVQRPIAERFLEQCVEKTRKLRLGRPDDPDVDIGPMIRPAQLERVLAQLDDAVARGAKVLTGARRRPDLGPAYLEPAVVTNVTRQMALMREETFGPVLPVAVVEDEEQAIREANDSPFTLGASVWTRNADRGWRVASRLRAGSVMVNDVVSYFGICEAPHGGSRSSGWGRTHARAGLLELVHQKYLDVDLLPGMPKVWWYGYNQKLVDAAEHVLEMMFSPRWTRKLRSAPRMAGLLWRKGRV
jgi:succinate-semialdehyde dehydrogenase/glutarate-semialdehyde dehydrogenase